MDNYSSKADSYYSYAFVKNPDWNKKYPNPEEATRAGMILPQVAGIVNRHTSESDRKLQIIDAGCGRGWLTALLAMYGEVVGIEPTKQVVEYARQLYPGLRFEVATIKQFVEQGEFVAFDIVVSSEVIEHVPYEQQQEFMSNLKQLMTPGGSLILTTPRGELKESYGLAHCNQPIEDWLTEQRLHLLGKNAGLTFLRLHRFYPVIVPNTRGPIWGNARRVVNRLLKKLGYIDSNHMIYQMAVFRNESSD